MIVFKFAKRIYFFMKTKKKNIKKENLKKENKSIP